MKKSVMSLTLAAAIALALPASGQEWATMNYVGFGWEEGGFPPSNYGDALQIVTTVHYADPIFEVDLAVDELTFYMYDLISWGEVDLGGGVLLVEYGGGMVEVWRDPQKNAEYGINPPNATCPSTFNDGYLYFRGPFTDFTMVLYADGTGEYLGNANGLEGELIDEICFGCVFTFAGVFTQEAGAQVLEGFDFQVTGSFKVDESVSTEHTSWSRVKALFN